MNPNLTLPTSPQVKKINPKVNRCTICLTEWPSPGHLEIHIRGHTGEKPYACTICPFTTGYAHVLRNHLKNHDPNTPKNHKCTHESCDYATATMLNLKKHMKRHLDKKDRQFKCEFCPFTANRPNHLDAHIRSHTKEKPFTCKLCPQTFSTSVAYKKHRESSHFEGDYNSRPFPCTVEGCTYRALRKCVLKQHIKVVHPSEREKNRFKCNFSNCEKAYCSTQQLKRHQSVHAPKVMEKVTEKVKGKVTEEVTEEVTEKAKEKVIEQVTKEVPEKVTEKVTEEVTEKVTEKVTDEVTEKVTEKVKKNVQEKEDGIQSAKKKIQVTSISDLTPILTCPYSNCEYYSHYKRYMDIHIKKKHSVPTTKVKCPIDGCPFTSYHVSGINRHKHEMHGEKLKCPEAGCTYSTRRRPRLNIHRLNAHTEYESRPFKCTWRNNGEEENEGEPCTFAAWTQKEIDEHYRRKHEKTGQGPTPRKRATCNICGELRTKLTVHMRTHTGEKPYKCELCPKSFAFPANFKAHQKRNHKKMSRVKMTVQLVDGAE